MKRLLLGTCALVGSLGAAAAAEPTIEERLEELEKAYVELMISDGKKAKEIERLNAELEGIRGGAPAEETHEHEHGQSQEHGHGHEHEHGHGHAHAGDVLLESDGFRVYVPSIGLDLVGYGDRSDPDLEERFGSLRGFGHGHDHEEGHDHEGHAHAQLEDGFNLRHAEIGLAAEVLDVGRAQVLINASLDGVELEEAFFQSVPLADLATVKLGKFRSGFGFFNATHSPEWDFADAPMAHYLLIGDHGLSDLGAQLVLTPSGAPLQIGLEVFQGDGETLFARDEGFGDAPTPGAGVVWAKARVIDSDSDLLEIGLAGGFGIQQQALGHFGHEEHEHEDEHEHEEDEEHEHEEEHELGGDGTTWFFSPGFAYLSRGDGERGEGDLRLSGEYILRQTNLDAVGGSESFRSLQDGYYLQGLYGVAPGLDVGLRWEQIGLLNDVRLGEEREDYGSSWRASGLVSYRFNEWIRAGVQVGYGSYDFEDGRDEVFQALGRVTVQLGPHFH